jgi:hypothetical protein
LEQAQPEHNDEDEMDDIMTLYAPFVRRLIVTQLQAWKPPLHWDEEDIPEFYPTDHISFDPIFKKLINVEEFDLVYGTYSFFHFFLLYSKIKDFHPTVCLKIKPCYRF